jgi:phospholipase/carboxylesterase
MWTFERVVPADAAIVAFEAEAPDSIGGYSWWSIDSTLPIHEYAEPTARLLSQASMRLEALFELSPSKRVAIGFSQGAALLSASILSGALRLDAVALLAGFVVEPHEIHISGRPRVFVAHGTKDEVVSFERATAGVARLRELGLTVDFIHDDVGHKIGSQAMRALQTWMEGVLSGPRR